MHHRYLIASLSGSLALVSACGARTELPAPDRVDDAYSSPSPPTCEDDSKTYIYVVTSANELLRFDPPSASFTTIGKLDCPSQGGATPFSMAIDRKGTAYVVYQSGELFEVSTKTAECKPTTFVPKSNSFSTFGMGFSADETSGGETLFVADSNFSSLSAGLGSIDTTSFEFTFIAPFTPTLGSAVELTGTGDGRLYGIFINNDNNANSSNVGRIDKRDGTLSEIIQVPLGDATRSLAFSFWGGDFYVFHADDSGPTNVTRLRPDDGSFVDVAQLPTHVVGVGVSTCAPR